MTGPSTVRNVFDVVPLRRFGCRSGASLPGRVAEVLLELGAGSTLDQPLAQLVDQPIRAGQLLRPLVLPEQLIDQLVRDLHPRPSSVLLPGRPTESLLRGYAAIVTTPSDEPVRYTEIRALPSLVAAGLEPSLDLQAWAEIFAYESPLGERTPLEGVRLVQPATTLVLGLTGGERSHERWRYRIEPETHADEGELVAEFGRVLEQAVIRRTDAKTALALSGGLDSRCVATILRRRSPSTVACTYGAVSSEDLVLGTQVAAETGLPHLAHSRSSRVTSPAGRPRRSGRARARCARFHAHHVALRELRRSQGVHSLLSASPATRSFATLPSRPPLPTRPGSRTPFTRPGPPLLPTDSRARFYSPALPPAFRVVHAFTRTTPCQEDGDPPARVLQYLFRQTLRRKTLPGAQLFDDDLAPRDPYDDVDLIDFCRRMPAEARCGGSLQRAYLSGFGALGLLKSPKDGMPPSLTGRRRRAAAVAVRARTAARARVEVGLGVSHRPDRRGIGDYATDLRAHGADLLAVLLEPRTLLTRPGA